MEKKYQVFISSTYKDLIEERKAIQEVLLMADCIPAGMEAFVATNDEQFNVIKKVIDLCDYYVLIIGGRYGSINETTGLSYTEMEYDYAVEREIPVLVFCLDSSVQLSDEKNEDDEDKRQKLENFKIKAMGNRLASIWKGVSDLASQAAISIMKAKQDIERPGWVRADTVGEYTCSELLAQINELRIENKNMRSQLHAAEARASAAEKLEVSELAFDDTKIVVSAHSLNGNYNKTSNLRELFGIISLKMLSGFINTNEVASILCGFAGGSRTSKLDDITLAEKLINQYCALGLMTAGPLGISLTEFGRKVRDEITLIKK